MKSEFKWGWVDKDGKVLEDTYNTAEEALSGLNTIHGEEITLEDYAKVGFYLARVKITLEVVSVMSDFN